MLKRKLCQAVFKWELHCKGPLLIRDERARDHFSGKQKDGYPSCLFVSHASQKQVEQAARSCAKKPPSDLPFYVPGTSIRGPARAHAERIVRTLLPPDAVPPYTACDPFEQEDPATQSCSKRLEGKAKGREYAEACPACKLFGYAGHAGRIHFTDADIHGADSVYRDMIGIDRFTGGVQGANMRFHVLENAAFSTTVSLVNFELWQLGLLAYLFRDFEMGLVPIGFGKTKGFGLVTGKVAEVTLTYLSTPTHIEHLGTLASANEKVRYGLDDCPAPDLPPSAPVDHGISLYKSVQVTDTRVFFERTALSLNARMEKLARASREKERAGKESPS